MHQPINETQFIFVTAWDENHYNYYIFLSPQANALTNARATSEFTADSDSSMMPPPPPPPPPGFGPAPGEWID